MCNETRKFVAGATIATTEPHLPWRFCPGAALVIGMLACTAPQANYPAGQSVVMIAGDVDCQGNDDPEVARATRIDAKRLRDTVREGLVVVGDQAPPDPTTVRETLEHSGSTHGLAIFYSGHGDDGNTINRVARICVGRNPDDKLIVSDIIATSGRTSPGQPLWVFALLNSCYSAHVDVSNKGRAASVLTVAHDSLDAFRAHSNGAEGTLVGNALVSVTGKEGDYGPLDLNCDGLITDQELFERLLTELSRDNGVQGVRSPPHLNLRRDGATHIPIAFRPTHHVGCDPEKRRTEIQQMLDELSGDAASDVQSLIGQQFDIAKEYGFRSPHARIALPQSRSDFFVVDVIDAAKADTLRSLAVQAGLQRFPGTLAQAEVIGPYSISFEIYVIRLELGGSWMKVIRLRDKRLMYSGPAASDESILPLKRLAERVAWVPVQYDVQDVVVQFRGKLPSQSTNLDGLLPRRGIVFEPGRSTPVACEEEVGQCFIIRPR